MRITNLKLLLVASGKKQQRIAELANVSATCISRVVQGKDQPSKKVKQAFCEALGMSENQLFGVGESKKAS